MKINILFKKILLASLLISSFVNVYASTPTLSLTNNGSNDSVIVSTKGDPNSPVILSYYSTTASGIQTHTIGSTNSNGTFWTIISTAAYSISSNGSVYVTINGQQSTSTTWPYLSNTSTSGAFSLNQTGLVLSLGQTSTLTATNATSMYLFNNTNPSVVNVSISGNQINVSANSNGSTVFTVCSGSSSNCISVYVTVQNNNAQLLTFSQSNATVTTGQTVPISIYGGSGVYTIVSNSNASIIQASLNGTTLNLYGNSGNGQSSITVCTLDLSSCGIINATIGTMSSSPIAFSQTSPTLAVGQTISLILSGSSGTYSISSNSNSGSVQASISGSSLTLYGISYGTSNIVVCSSTGSCGPLTVSVSSGGGGGAITLSQSNLVLVSGQTVGVTISGGSLPYNVSSNATGIVQNTLNTNILTLTGLSSGSTSVNVCSSGGGCTAISVVVNASTGGTGVSATPGFSQNTLTLNSGQNSTISIIGNGSYYLAGNTNGSIAGAVISGSNVVITANANGTTVITICQSTSQCNTITVTVGNNNNTVTTPIINPIILIGQKSIFTMSGGSSYYLSSPANNSFLTNISGNTLTITGVTVGQGQVILCSSSNRCLTFIVNVTNSSVITTPSTPISVTTKYIFNNPLTFGASGQEVIELQKRLHEEGYFKGSYVAKYGDATLAAVKKYQKAHGLSQIGNLGPATRAFLNK
jgi:hypothetical protein